MTRMLGTFLLAAAAGTAVAQPVFHAGAGINNVTPPLGASIAGHMQDRAASFVHDELHARCLVLDDGTTKLVFAIVDSCMIPREIFDAAKAMVREETGIPVENILMAATHTHSAPCSTPVFQSDPDPEYQRFLTRSIADAVLMAVENREPARIAWGSVDVPGEVFNRRWYMKSGTVGENAFGQDSDGVRMNPPQGSENLVEPAGPIDPQVSILAVERTDGRPIALLANYSLHYVGGVPGDHISADYFGVFAQRIAELLDANDADPAFVAMMSNGTSGDINNINFREAVKPREPYEQINHVGNSVADAVHGAYGTLKFKDWVELGAARTEIELGVRMPTSTEVSEAQSLLEGVETPYSDLRHIYARETQLLHYYPESVPVILQAFRIGELGVAAIPCEVFVEIGLELKQKSALQPAFVIELANGYNGYLPTAEHHKLGGYETWRARSSYLEVDAAEKIVDNVLGLLSSLKAK